jgi:hypothetical protein
VDKEQTQRSALIGGSVLIAWSLLASVVAMLACRRVRVAQPILITSAMGAAVYSVVKLGAGLPVFTLALALAALAFLVQRQCFAWFRGGHR